MSRSMTRTAPNPAITVTAPVEDVRTRDRVRVAGFFPGLGSRGAYQNLGRSLLDAGVPEITALYEEAARALGVPGRPERLLLTAENLPGGTLERQGFIGAALLVHSLALDAFLRDRIDERGTPVGLVAYTGESFGILAAAVASGSLSVFDGVKIAQAFTPLMLLAAGAVPAEHAAPAGPANPADSTDTPDTSYGGGSFARAIAWYLPESVRRTPLVPEPSHVLAVRAGTPDALAAVLDEIRGSYPARDVELHKAYSPTQANLYVRTGVKAGFDRFMAAYPHIATEELKDPTAFLAHSSRMRPARHALERFLDVNHIRFEEPRVPVVSNHDASLLTTAAGVRRGVLAMTDQVMASRDTCEILGGLDTDVVLELGPGDKSVQLLKDNGFAAPVMAYTGGEEDTETFLRAVTVVDSLMASLERLYPAGEQAHEQSYERREHRASSYDVLRELFRLAERSEFCDDYFSRTLGRVITAEMLRPAREGSAAFYALLETFQHTRGHREHIAVGRGELVVKARLKKRITRAAHEDPALLGRAAVELKVLDQAGRTSTRTVDTDRPEVLVFHFDGLAGVDADTMARRTRLLLDTQPTALQTYNQLLEGLRRDRHRDRINHTVPRIGHRVVYQYLLFDALVQHRPGLFAQSDHYLEGGDPLGWLIALAVAGSLTPADAVVLYELYEARAQGEEIERVLDRLTEAEIPLVSPEGVPAQSRRDLQDATRAVLLAGALDGAVRRIHLNGNCQLLALGSDLEPGLAGLDAGRFDAHLVRITEPAESWRKRLNPALDDLESACVLALTEENERVLHNARSRRLLSSTVYAYTHIDEAIVNFGKGGSESMTIFVRKAGEERITVRKILSEALTTAHWHPDGDGVMLPPFAKAAKQAEFLQSLPAPVSDYFPEVYDVLEREVPVGGPGGGSADGSVGGSVGREVIYEMSYVAGDEVSRFIEKHTPPPAVVARLYQQIIRVLHEDVHSVGRVAAPGETLDISYFRKIEDRLALCRRTAPRTFNPALLDTERIVVNGVSYLNSGALLERFRSAPEFLEVLEPAFHSLVMGDTNTENIKITNSEPLLHAQRLIESGAGEGQVRAALDAITAEALGVKFLDPRAIGFKGEGRDTRDDAMYDNKPWHNSIGHYDEIHFEQFTMNVAVEEGTTPRVDIAFLEGNPYQLAYRVRDVVAGGGTVDPDSPKGMEDWFAPVMTAALGLDEPGSPFLRDDPYWLIRFVFMMGQHFTAMPPFHFQQELDGTLLDTYQTQRRPVAIYCEGVKWLNWALDMLEGTRTEFLGLRVPPLPYRPAHH
ncbi:ACP S-malonyltransferase [Streptomyces sp. ME02-8801-2C]|uniref:ACP S-malonyltransferase n=1 Tax=Streptomyces sp. ME02-8801-2C TaxID=3028680 RepID=UPI0029B034A5|nr:ACP S-malonyltransferase [Streptomyces sp. ME02-8801-2C]MDX3456246.1 ACP S-malonyltransferase [Streptomyces sp. ME02-8801-2C]